MKLHILLCSILYIEIKRLNSTKKTVHLQALSNHQSMGNQLHKQKTSKLLNEVFERFPQKKHEWSDNKKYQQSYENTFMNIQNDDTPKYQQLFRQVKDKNNNSLKGVMYQIQKSSLKSIKRNIHKLILQKCQQQSLNRKYLSKISNLSQWLDKNYQYFTNLKNGNQQDEFLQQIQRYCFRYDNSQFLVKVLDLKLGYEIQYIKNGKQMNQRQYQENHQRQNIQNQQIINEDIIKKQANLFKVSKISQEPSKQATSHIRNYLSSLCMPEKSSPLIKSINSSKNTLIIQNKYNSSQNQIKNLQKNKKYIPSIVNQQTSNVEQNIESRTKPSPVQIKIKRQLNPFLTVILQQIPYRLSDIGCLQFEQMIYILECCVNGLHRLWIQDGITYYLNNQMICFNAQGQCKIWVNERLQVNQYSENGMVIDDSFIEVRSNNHANQKETQIKESCLALPNVQYVIKHLFQLLESQTTMNDYFSEQQEECQFSSLPSKYLREKEALKQQLDTFNNVKKFVKKIKKMYKTDLKYIKSLRKIQIQSPPNKEQLVEQLKQNLHCIEQTNKEQKINPLINKINDIQKPQTYQRRIQYSHQQLNFPEPQLQKSKCNNNKSRLKIKTNKSISNMNTHFNKFSLSRSKFGEQLDKNNPQKQIKQRNKKYQTIQNVFSSKEKATKKIVPNNIVNQSQFYSNKKVLFNQKQQNEILLQTKMVNKERNRKKKIFDLSHRLKCIQNNPTDYHTKLTKYTNDTEQNSFRNNHQQQRNIAKTLKTTISTNSSNPSQKDCKQYIPYQNLKGLPQQQNIPQCQEFVNRSHFCQRDYPQTIKRNINFTSNLSYQNNVSLNYDRCRRNINKVQITFNHHNNFSKYHI